MRVWFASWQFELRKRKGGGSLTTMCPTACWNYTTSTHCKWGLNQFENHNVKENKILEEKEQSCKKFGSIYIREKNILSWYALLPLIGATSETPCLFQSWAVEQETWHCTRFKYGLILNYCHCFSPFIDIKVTAGDLKKKLST